MAKTKTGFRWSLGAIALFIFASVFVQAYFGWNWNPYIVGVAMMLAGFGLMIEAEVFTWAKSINLKDGLNTTEITKLITAIVGFTAMGVGLLSMPFLDISNVKFVAVQGWTALVAGITTAVQIWLID